MMVTLLIRTTFALQLGRWLANWSSEDSGDQDVVTRDEGSQLPEEIGLRVMLRRQRAISVS